jgi:penicillin-binding protein 1A
VDLARERPLALRSTIAASNGAVLAHLFKQNRSLVPLRAVPRTMRRAVLAAEDARFYAHGGFDVRSIARAALANLREGSVVQGGSTITQQYVKNSYFRAPARSLERKAEELRLSIEVERTLSKRTILERYLNTVYFGEGAYGIEAAAESFFGHPAAELTLAQAAQLAAMIKSPASYDPRSHPRLARERRDYVLRRMVLLGWTSREAARRARRSPLGLSDAPPRFSTRRPYFVEAVKREVLDDERLGRSEPERARALFEGGLEVTSTLEPRLQEAAERAVAEVLNQPGDPSAAVVAIRPQSGEIAAMVGGDDWSSSQVNLALGQAGGGSGRQPGSVFKAIDAVTAMEAGITLDTEYESSPATFELSTGEPWEVGNYEGTGYGAMTLGEALVGSVNGVYARLALDVGAGQIATQAHIMGVRSRLEPHPSIALGAEEVSVLDMAAAYATLANQGTAVEPTTIRSVALPNGEILEPEQRVVPGAVSPGNAYLVSKVLEQVIERGTGTAAAIGRPAAGKTGTTNGYTDAWFVGYTPQLVAAVWIGHPEGLVPMTDVHGVSVTGGSLPAAIWRSFMTAALRGEPVEPFRLPRRELVTVEIDPVSGLLAASWCPGEPQEMLRQLVPTLQCPVPPPPSPSVAPLPSTSVDPSPTGSPPPGMGASPVPTTSPSASGSAPSGNPSARPSDGGGKGSQG